MAAEQTGTALERFLARKVPEPQLVVGANERSPNRKPRYHRKDLRFANTQEAKKTFLTLYRDSGKFSQSLRTIARSPGDVSNWVLSDPEFADAYHEVKTLRQEMNAERLMSLNWDAISAMDKAINSDDGRLSFMAADRHLRGVGIYTERQKKEISGPNGGPIPISGVVYHRVVREEIDEK